MIWKLFQGTGSASWQSLKRWCEGSSGVSHKHQKSMAALGELKRQNRRADGGGEGERHRDAACRDRGALQGGAPPPLLLRPTGRSRRSLCVQTRRRVPGERRQHRRLSEPLSWVGQDPRWVTPSQSGSPQPRRRRAVWSGGGRQASGSEAGRVQRSSCVAVLAWQPANTDLQN